MPAAASGRFDALIKKTSHIALVAATAASLVISACGGSAASSSRQAQILSHDQLVSQADRICGTYSHTVSQEFRTVKSADDAGQVWDTYVGQFDKLIVDLRALRPSPQDAHAYATWLDAGERQRPLILAARPPSSDDARGRLVMAAARVNDMAASLGMRDCAIDIDLSERTDSPQRYAQLADSICADAEAAYGTVDEPSDLSGFDAYIEQLMPLFRSSERDLDAIPASPGHEQQVAAWSDTRRHALDAIAGMQVAARQGNNARFERLSAATQRWTDRGYAIANQLGLTVCGK
jgi:hypothetical protein